jgi:hypothetical protein
VVFLEGFKELVNKNKGILKIVVVKSKKETLEALRSSKPILAFTGPYSTENLKLKIPYVNTLENPEKIAELVEKTVA